MLTETLPEAVYISNPSAFCAGVRRAINIVENELAAPRPEDSRVVVIHEIVHNKHEVERLRRMGAVFVDDASEVLPTDRVVLSAHGHSPFVAAKLKDLGLQSARDATCPLVENPHEQTRKAIDLAFSQKALATIMYVGHPGHAECEGMRGEAQAYNYWVNGPRGELDRYPLDSIRDRKIALSALTEDRRSEIEVFDPEIFKVVETVDQVAALKVSADRQKTLLMQTTLAYHDALKVQAAVLEKHPDTVVPRVSDVCFATQNRQDGVREMVRRGATRILVLTSANSSNGRRLGEVAQDSNKQRIATGLEPVQSFSFDDVGEFKLDWILGARAIGITAAASTSPRRIDEVRDFLVQSGLSADVFQEVFIKKEPDSFAGRAINYQFNKL